MSMLTDHLGLVNYLRQRLRIGNAIRNRQDHLKAILRVELGPYRSDRFKPSTTCRFENWENPETMTVSRA